MQRKIDIEGEDVPRNGEGAEEAEPDLKVTDKRHWQQDEELEVEDNVEPARPTIIDEFRGRAEEAERKLHEYIEAHKKFKTEQEGVRVRLTRDVERRVDLRFAELVGSLLETVDNLDLALRHAEGHAAAAPLAEGVALARSKFLENLVKAGIERVAPDGEPFDPNFAEAVRVDPVDDAAQDGIVTETLRPGYRLGESLIRAAQVAVGRRQ